MSDIGKRVWILEGDYEGSLGEIIKEYEGWGFIQYTIKVDCLDIEVDLYHDQVEILS